LNGYVNGLPVYSLRKESKVTGACSSGSGTMDIGSLSRDVQMNTVSELAYPVKHGN
jgi:hypothetical protein